MAIYLEDFERNYLISLITGIKYTGNKPIEVPEKTIPTKIINDAKRIERTQQCDHTFGKYTGEKICCTKCGMYGEGMGYTWTLQKTIDPETYKIPKFENPQKALFA